jgi:integral membrane protein
MSPRLLFRRVAVAEAITWALLLTGMFLKYVTETTELGVSVFGMLHGVVFVAYAVVAVVVAVDQRWTARRTVAALASAVPPFATVPFDRWVEKHHPLEKSWRLRTADPAGPLERLVAWLVRSPAQGVAAGLVAVAALTGLALLVGPPTG